MNLNTTIMLLAESVSDALLFDGIRASVFELKTALNIMLELIKQIIERLCSSGAIIYLRSEGIDSSAVLFLGGREHPLVITLYLGDHCR